MDEAGESGRLTPCGDDVVVVSLVDVEIFVGDQLQQDELILCGVPVDRHLCLRWEGQSVGKFG